MSFNLRVVPCISEQVVYLLSFPQSSINPLAHAINISINPSIIVEGIWLLLPLKEKEDYKSIGGVVVPPPIVKRWRKMCIIFHCYMTLWNTSIQRYLKSLRNDVVLHWWVDVFQWSREEQGKEETTLIPICKHLSMSSTFSFLSLLLHLYFRLHGSVWHTCLRKSIVTKWSETWETWERSC